MVVATTPVSRRAQATTRKQTVTNLYRAGFRTGRIAQLTHLSRRRVTEIVKESIAQGLRDSSIEEIRIGLYVDLEELLVITEQAFYHNPDLSRRERNRLVCVIVRLIHEQAWLMGLHAPRQVAVVKDQPVKNEQAEAFARDVARFIELSNKMVGPAREDPELSFDAESSFDGEVSEFAAERSWLLSQVGEVDMDREPTLSAESFSGLSTNWSSLG
jgi:hypothetical protein